MRSEVEAALQSTTEMLSQVTRLLALVSAPPLETATVRHVEVLAAPAAGRDGRRRSPRPAASRRSSSPSTAPVDPGLASWAGEYLNERLAGVGLGTHLLRRRFDDPSLSARERAFLDALRPRSSSWPRRPRSRSTSAAPPLLDDVRADELEACRRLSGAREAGRAARAADATPSTRAGPFVRVGLDHPGLHDVALVGATYGLPTRIARRGRPARPGADGLRQGDPHGPRRRVRALALRRGRYDDG